MNDYQPTACDLHSQYELFAMHRAWVDAYLVGESDARRVRVLDVVIRDRAEYLVVQSAQGVDEQWRLDRIERLQEVVGNDSE